MITGIQFKEAVISGSNNICKNILTKYETDVMIRLQTGGILMDYDKIIIDLLNRIVTLEEKVAKLENTG